MIKIIPILDKSVHYYVGVSMGVDSLAALFYLKGRGYNVKPVHFNHKLRPQNDEMEEKFSELCEKEIGYNYELGWAECGLQTESDCRAARINFFSKICNGGILITAHHLDDVVESYLLNCFRGHPERKPFSLMTDFVNFKIIHPFLLTEKKDFRQFLIKMNLMDWVVEDETNSIIKGSRRNWIRNKIIPEMESQKLSLKKYCKRLIMSMVSEREERV